MAIWQVYKNNAWVDMPDPSKLTINSEDLDVDSYRSVVNGNLIRNKLGTWITVGFEFNFRLTSEVEALMNNVINIYPLRIKIDSPILAVSGKNDLTGYVGKSSVERIYSQVGTGYTVSFNFIEGQK
jgi:hypothetical protein